MEEQKLNEFCNTINAEILELIMKYKDSENKEEILKKIYMRLKVLEPLNDIEYKKQQLNAIEMLKTSDFAKNFNIKDMIGALKNLGN